MAVEELKKTLVLGHRNPDTDSICSAICYAGFKHQLTGENYEPCRAGNVNPETQYVLDYFKLKAPRGERQDAGQGHRDPQDKRRVPWNFLKECMGTHAGEQRRHTSVCDGGRSPGGRYHDRRYHQVLHELI